MLILDRTIGESVMIGEDIIVAILEIHGRNIKIGITAPDTLRILRTELMGRTDKTAPQTFGKAFDKILDKTPDVRHAAGSADSVESKRAGRRQENAGIIRRRLGLPPRKK